MYVCLMRHGKAEPYTEGCDDNLRQLTEKGWKQAAIMTETARSWWPQGKTALWASPSLRTLQTASFFLGRIAYESFSTYPAIATGNFQSVYRGILCREDADVVCIVGHSPYLGQWAKLWTGTEIEFKTGSMALFDYDPYEGESGTASLLLYLTPRGARLMKERPSV